MKLVAITPELPHRHEVEFIMLILEAGFDYVHLRKPDFDLQQMRSFIEEIPQQYRVRLKLHSHFELVSEYDVAGLHLNHRANVVPQTATLSGRLRLSRSCHAANELVRLDKYEYVFLSPIFDSISKRGYASRFSQGDLIEIFKHSDTQGKVVALGGIMPGYMVQLSRLGFAGAAFLGYLFNSETTDELKQKLIIINNTIKCYNL